MLQSIKPYKKDHDYSYTLGVFLTIELLIHKPEKVISVLLSSQAEKNTGVTKIIELCELNSIPVEVNDRIIARLSPKENCYALGILEKYALAVEPHKNHVVLVNPMDSGNLGTIFRTCLGFGIKNLVIIRPSVDPFDPKTIRASMGALFSVNFTQFDHFQSYMEQYPGQELYPFMLEAKKSLHDVETFMKSPFSLVFGNESSGLPAEFSRYGTSVVIPHSNDIDSLNLSMAVGLALYSFTKQNFSH